MYLFNYAAYVCFTDDVSIMPKCTMNFLYKNKTMFKLKETTMMISQQAIKNIYKN